MPITHPQPRPSTRRRRRWPAAVAALAAAALTAIGLAACGGGTSQVEDFIAERIFAIGDETSTLTPEGRKYAVNVLDANKAVSCATEPIWVQAVARLYGHVFAECNPDAVADPRAIMLAGPQQTVAEHLAAQVDAALARRVPGEPTLATVMMGANDVWALYDEFVAGRSEDDVLAEARRRGELLGTQINRLVERDIRVVVSTVPDLGRTPFALAEKEAHDDIDRAALISRLARELNARMRLEIVNDGRLIGLVLADEMVQAMTRQPAAFGLANVEDAACATALPACDTDTLVSGARSNTWLWADGRHLAYGGQVRLGLLAQSRASNNPF